MLVQDVGEQSVARVQIVGPQGRNVRERQQQSPRAVQQAGLLAGGEARDSEVVFLGPDARGIALR